MKKRRCDRCKQAEHTEPCKSDQGRAPKGFANGSRHVQPWSRQPEAAGALDGLGHKPDPNGCDGEHGNVDDEHQGQRRWCELSQAPGEQWTKAESTHVRPGCDRSRLAEVAW